MTAADPNPALSTRRRLFSLFRFTFRARQALWVGAILIVLVMAGVLCLLLTGGPPRETAWESAVTILGGLLLVVTPLALFFLILAALLEKRVPPRALLWLGLAVFFGLAGAFFALLSVLDLGDAVPGIVFFLVFIGPLFLLLSLPAVYYLAKTVPDVRAVLKDSRDERVLALIQARGKISSAELAQDAAIPAGELDGIIDELLSSGRLAGLRHPRHQLIFTSAYLDARQRLLLDLLHSTGRLALDQLAAALAVPRDVLDDWLYQVIQRGQFTGYINWKEGRIYSIAAGKIGRQSQCPNCGGQLAPAGGEIIRCVQCSSEVSV